MGKKSRGRMAGAEQVREAESERQVVGGVENRGERERERKGVYQMLHNE